MSRINRIFRNPGKYLSIEHIINNVIGGRLFPLWVKCSKFVASDELFLKVYYRLAMHEKLDFKKPVSYTQKIQWLKLHNTNPLYSQMVDKYEVRKIIAKELGEEYLIPLLGVWDKFDEIDFDALPAQFVLKTTHDSGNVVICKDRALLDIAQARKKLSNALKTNYFYKSREYPYKNVVPRIIAEIYIYDKKQTELDDYKFFCFKGEPRILQITTNKGEGKKVNYFDIFFNALPFFTGCEGTNNNVLKPESYAEMIEIARKLSKNIIHVRIDLYNIDGKIFFGEYTFHNSGGIVRFSPPEWNGILGDMINL